MAAGDDLARIVLDACARAAIVLEDGDVVCVAQKVVSKSEGAFADAYPGEDVHDARRRIARSQAVRVVADTETVLIVETRHGFVCANAGVDGSNVPDGRFTLLPDDPDASARAIAQQLRAASGAAVAVVITDTFGRAWRVGQTDVAIGVAGLAPLRDERGQLDRTGRPLEVTVVAVADELAAAADLARAKASGTPVVIVRGAGTTEAEDARAGELIREAREDLFRWGGPQAVIQGVSERRRVAAVVPCAVATEHLEAARSAAAAVAGAVIEVAAGERSVTITLVTDQRGDDDLIRAGAALHAAEVVLSAYGYATAWRPGAGATVGTLDIGRAPLA